MRTENLNAKTTKAAPPPRKFPKPKQKTVFLPFQFKLKRPKFKILCRKKMPYHILISILALSKCLDCQRLLPQQPDPLQFNNVLGRNLTTTTQQITTATTTPSIFSTASTNFQTSNNLEQVVQNDFNPNCGFEINWSGTPMNGNITSENYPENYGIGGAFSISKISGK